MKTIGKLSDIYDFQYGKGNENRGYDVWSL